MKTFILILAIINYIVASAQTVRVTNITGQALIQGDISPNQARKIALTNAKLNALKAAGIPEKLSCYQSLTTNQVDNSNNQSFTSHIQSDLLGAIRYDSITEEKIMLDSNSRVVYQVKINAVVTTYAAPSVLPSPLLQQHYQSHAGVFAYYNGDTYSGQWLNGKRNGYGTYRWANGAQYTGYYLNGFRNGPGTYYFPNGQRIAGTWNNGIYNRQGYQPQQSNYATTSQNGYAQPHTTANTSSAKPDKLTNDENRFSQEAEAEYQKLQ